MTTKYSSRQNNLPGIARFDHRHLGREFERELEATHAYYETRGLAKIDRHPHEWEFISEHRYRELLRDGKLDLIAACANGRKMVRKAANVDYSGTAKSSAGIGLHVKFDAKMSRGIRIPLGNFERHQVDNLVLSTRCGAIAGFMINFYEAGLIFFAPAALIRAAMDKNLGKARAAKGDGSISVEELRKNAIEIPLDGKNLIDWHSHLIK